MRKYLITRYNAFGYAIKGILSAFRLEAHMQIHLLAAVVVVGFAIWVGLERWEWVAIILAIGLVWTAELLNSALEELTDVASPDFNPKAGRAKDLAAGAVLIASMAAAGLGLVVFGSRLWVWLVTLVS